MQALQALELEAAGEREQALVRLAGAIALARPAGAVAVFADEGAPMAGLLRRLAVARRRGRLPEAGAVPVEYLSRLLRAAAPGTVGAPIPAGAPTVPDLVEPLTAREREVLRLLAGGRANRQIAEELFVGLDTVKKHVTHVCQKLGAANRTQAVVHARELGLIG